MLWGDPLHRKAVHPPFPRDNYRLLVSFCVLRMWLGFLPARGHTGCSFLRVGAPRYGQKCRLHPLCGQCPTDRGQLSEGLSKSSFLLITSGSGSGPLDIVYLHPLWGVPLASMGVIQYCQEYLLGLLNPHEVGYVAPANRYFLFVSAVFFILYPIRASCLLPNFAVLGMETVHFIKC